MSLNVEQSNAIYTLIGIAEEAINILKNKSRGSNDPLWDLSKWWESQVDNIKSDYKKWQNERR